MMDAYTYTAGNEGRRHSAYLDSRGIPTIGIGFTDTMITTGKSIILGLYITNEEIDAEWHVRFPKAIQEASNDIGIDVWPTLDPVRQAALSDIAYQDGGGNYRTGEGGLAGYHRMLSAIREKNWRKSSQECLDSLDFKQTPPRCKKNANMLLTGLWPDQQSAPVPFREVKKVATSQSTGAMLGVGAAFLDLINWWFTGHPFPMPDDVKASAVVMSGYVAHLTQETTSQFFQMISARFQPKPPPQVS